MGTFLPFGAPSQWRMTAELLPIILTTDEIRAITGAIAPTVQFNELRRLGFTRVRRGLDRSLILERAHYEAVCAGAIVLPPGKLPKAADALLQPQRHGPELVQPPAPPQLPAPAPPPPRRPDPRKITVEEWAAQNYSDPPSRWVLGKWRRGGQIHPAPERVGRDWFVPVSAVRIGDVPYGYVPLIDRLKANAS